MSYWFLGLPTTGALPGDGDEVQNAHERRPHRISDAQMAVLLVAVRAGCAAASPAGPLPDVGSWAAGFAAGLRHGECLRTPAEDDRRLRAYVERRTSEAIARAFEESRGAHPAERRP